MNNIPWKVFLPLKHQTGHGLSCCATWVENGDKESHAWLGLPPQAVRYGLFQREEKDEKQVRVREAEEQAKRPVTWWRTVAGTTA